MSSATSVLTITAGADETIKLGVYKRDEDDPSVLVVQDITGWTLYFAAKEEPDDTADYLIEKDSTDAGQILITSYSTGKANLFIKAINSAPLCTGTFVKPYYWDFWGKTASGEYKPLCGAARLNVKPRVYTGSTP